MARAVGCVPADRQPVGPKRSSHGQPKPGPAAPKDEASGASVMRLAEYGRRFSHDAILEGIEARLLKHGIGQGFLRLDEVQRFIPASTLARKVREGRKLAREEADQVARLLRIKVHAHGVFEDAATADTWLNEPNPALGDRVPVELVTTDEGTRAVETVLRRIDYGDYS